MQVPERRGPACTILDNDGGPTLSVDHVPVTEAQEAVFTGSLPTALEQPVTVEYATSDGSALAGADILPGRP